MCGIAGNWGALSGQAARRSVETMLDAMRHRGPDGRGVVEFAGGAVGMVRLALVDLSERGQQPMWSPDRQVAIVFNGEMYNFREERVRLEAKGYRFASATDTEVVLALYLEDPVDFTARLRGMYGLAILDWRASGPDATPELVLARDPFGIKPLYVAAVGDGVVFASELRGLLASGLVPRELDREGLCCYLEHGCLIQPRTMITGVRMVDAGTIERYGAGMRREVRRFEALPPAAPRDESLAEAAARLRAALEDSVALHAFADAPVGAFLSGGVDSTGIVAMMRPRLNRLRTFCLSFPDQPDLDESAHAEDAARRFDCEHLTVPVTGPEVGDVFPAFVASLDQPSADGFNTWLVSRAAAREVKGVLSGLGGDEWFAGYPVARRMAWSEHGFAGRITAATAAVVGRAALLLPRGRIRRRWLELSSWRSPLSLWARSHTAFTPEETGLLVGRTLSPEQIEERLIAAIREDLAPDLTEESAIGLAGLLDARVYMQSQLLRDSDATSMAHSLELRVPLVDRAVVRFSRSCLDGYKLKPDGGSGHHYEESGAKSVLRRALEDLLPPEIDHRPKRGFALPYRPWLRGPLWPLAEEALSPEAVRRRGLLDPAAVARVVEDARRDLPGAVYPRAWALVVLELWCREVLDRPSEAVA